MRSPSTTMRILFLTHRLPFPPNKGDKIRSFNILRHLTRRHEVHLATLVDDDADLAHVSKLEPLVRSISLFHMGGSARKLLALRGMLHGEPITTRYFYSGDLQERIDRLIDSVNFDCFFCYSSPMAEYLFRSRHWSGKISRALRIMDLIDVDSFKWRQYAQASPPWRAWVYRHEAKHLAAYEERIATTFDRLFVVSEQEKQYFPGGAATAHLHAMPNGVDLEFFAPGQSSGDSSEEPTLVFTGVMDYWPNVEGVRWFADHVFPRIQAAVPNVRLLIVGSRPVREVRRLASRRGIVVTGFVEDVRDYLCRASVCIVPLRIARGIQNKVLEAMAMGKAVVTTPQAFEGILAEPDRQIVVADGEERFAAATFDLLADRSRAEQIGREARRCVETFYSWAQNLRALDEIGQ